MRKRKKRKAAPQSRNWYKFRIAGVSTTLKEVALDPATRKELRGLLLAANALVEDALHAWD